MCWERPHRVLADRDPKVRPRLRSARRPRPRPPLSASSRVARTLADLYGDPKVNADHLARALAPRG
jgi:hypothetical protein